MPKFPFYNPWKCQKTIVFLMFSGGVQREHLFQISYYNEKIFTIFLEHQRKIQWSLHRPVNVFEIYCCLNKNANLLRLDIFDEHDVACGWNSFIEKIHAQSYQLKPLLWWMFCWFCSKSTEKALEQCRLLSFHCLYR